MNKTLSSVVGLVAVVALVVGIVAFNKAPQVITGSIGAQGPRGEQGEPGPRGPQGLPGKDAPVKLGSVSSPDFNTTYISVGGLRTESVVRQLLTASTTICNIQSPFATSTLEKYFVSIKTGTTSASIVEMGWASTPDATTTLITSFGLPANGKNQIAATSTLAHQVIPGGSWLVVKQSPTVGTASAGTVSDTGTCGAEFGVISY